MILHLAVPVPVYHGFDYLPPDGVAPAQVLALKPGIRIKVPWRNKGEVIGILLAVRENNKPEVNSAKLKKALVILDCLPLFPETMLSLLQFASRYYHYPIGEVFAAAMPVLLRQGKDTMYSTHEIACEALPEVAPILSPDQQVVIQRITQNFGQFSAFLLFGVTGSGKTEIYLNIIQSMLDQQKQALILVPEIGLTPQMIARFQKRFLVSIVVLHSGLTERQRQAAWLQALNGHAAIIIGTRSAIFTPLKNPGVIIIDEEHDISFKQQEGFRYSARDLAVRRAQLEKIPVILGSATPSLESLHNVTLRRYTLLSLPERAGTAVHPVFCVIDLKKQPTEHGLSLTLIHKIKTHLAEKNQVLVFLNQRGFSPVLICHDCGWIAECEHCAARMTLHQTPLHLACHHCGASQAMQKICPDCQARELYPLGAGTERLEQTLRKYFPKTLIIRIDKDTVKKKGSFEKKLSDIQMGAPCLLIGTQMLSKGHHFPEVTLSVIINIDSGFFSADFRGIEKTAQLIIQVAGRAGRAKKPGEVVLQTYHSDHKVLKILLEKGYASFAEWVLQERREAGFPPYQFFALIRAESISSGFSLNFLSHLKDVLQKRLQCQASQITEILGPVDSPMQKKAGKYRAQLLLQSATRQSIQAALDVCIQILLSVQNRQKIRWSIDVDPLEMA